MSWVKDEGDFLKVKAMEVLENKGAAGFYRVIILEGKKRHLRRLFKRLGFKVTLLKRVRIGRLCLGNLREGSYRLLDRGKIYSLLT